MRAAMSVRMARVLLAVTVACSWLLLAGPPATALVTRSSVESPQAGASLKKAKELVVAVDRTTVNGPEKITVVTQLFYGGTPAPPPPSEEPSEPPEGGDGEGGDAEGAEQADGHEQEQVQQQQEPGQLKPVSKKILALRAAGRQENPPAAETRRFAGAIDPYNLAWLPQPGVAPNGQYTLEYVVDSDATEGEDDRQRHEFRIDAPPPPQGAPGVGVQDAEAKQMIVAWQRNFAPDISSYTVERRLDDGKWRVAQDKIKPDQTQISDTAPAYGSYQYRVTAVRPAGDGSEEVRTATSLPSLAVELQRTSPEIPSGTGGDDPGTGDGTGGTGTTGGTGSSSTGTVPSLSGSPTTSGFGTQTDEQPGVALPRGFEDTYRGALDYDAEQAEVTERVPVEVAQGGTTEDGGTLTVLDRAVDQQRVLPPLAGGLILVLSAAHVLRYLNE